MAPLLLCVVLFQASFDVASVKPSKVNIDPAANGHGGSIRASAGQITMEGVSLWKVIANAYGIADDKDYAVTGPAWLRSERYDLLAKVPADTPKDEHYREQVQLMLQKLLADRFKLAVHHESKTMSGFELVVDKDGAKLKASQPDAPNSMNSGRGVLHAQGVTMSRLADFLARFANAPVVDQTKLAGRFDLDLEWTPDDEPSIFSAIQQQLGLKLQARKMPVDILVVDRAEKVPTEN